MKGRTRLLALAIALMVLGASCGADDSNDAESEAVSRAAGTLADPDLSSVVTALADGFGDLGAPQRRAVAGVAASNEVCDHRAGERADPTVSQVEVEIVTVVDDCLHFSYDVANFRSLVADIEQHRRSRNVIAVSPLLLEYKLDQLDEATVDESWQVGAITAGPSLALDAPTGQGTAIAIIDSGIDVTDPALASVDVRRVPDTGRGDYVSTGHGTVAARVIASPLGAASRPIAPNVRLLDVPADLCDADTCGCDPCAAMTAAEAVRWSTDNGADIISMSFGFRPAKKPAWWQLLLDGGEIRSAAQTIEVALAYASANDVAMVAAAGNCADSRNAGCETGDQFELPAGHAAVIAVAGLEPDAEGMVNAAWYSTRQDYVELAAPGSVVLVGADGELNQKTGTSFATPFVASSLAILVGTDGPLSGQPDALVQARALLAETALDLAPEGRDPASGHGQIQLDRAIEQASMSKTN